MSGRGDLRRDADRGSVMIVTLVLTVVLVVIVLVIAEFAIVGLRSSDVATERTETNSDSANVMSWAIEQFSKKQLDPDVDCGAAPTYLDITVPAALAANGSTTTLECAQTEPIAGEPVVHLIATSVGDQTRVVEATVEVPKYSHGARVSDWRVDVPINVPAYVTTTTVSPTTTTTTTTTTTLALNVPPVALPTIWYVAPNTTLTALLDASDPDGSIVGGSVTQVPGPPAAITTTWLAGNQVDVVVGAVAPATYDFDYDVTDDGGATSSSTVQIVVSAVPPTTTTTTSTTTTTTTTLPPAPSCTFEITSAATNGSSGTGNLAVSNAGGEFSGWQVRLTQKSSSKPWQFTWDVAVSAIVNNDFVFVTGTDTIPQSGSVNYAASIVQSATGNPKINVNDTLPCVVLSP